VARLSRNVETKLPHYSLRNNPAQRSSHLHRGGIEERSRNRYCCGTAFSITCSECRSVALVIQHDKRMRRIILPSMVCLALKYFSPYSHKWREFFWGKKSLNIKCVFVFTVFCTVCTVFLYCFVYVYLFLFVLSVLV
jgi:hypothetical protein